MVSPGTPYDHGLPKANVFTRLLKSGIDEGLIPERTKQARDWYRDKAKRETIQSDAALMSSDPTRFRSTVVPGRMYMFFYDPKHKKTLPYYDIWPMIFPVEMGNNYFLGLNLHYLPPNYRAILMDRLYEITNNKRFDETTRLQLSYKLLKNVSALDYFRPTLKKYLKAHVRSRFVSIGAEEWTIAAFLPLQRFEKNTTTKVWSDSVNKIQHGKPLNVRPTTKPRKPQ